MSGCHVTYTERLYFYGGYFIACESCGDQMHNMLSSIANSHLHGMNLL